MPPARLFERRKALVAQDDERQALGKGSARDFALALAHARREQRRALPRPREQCFGFRRERRAFLCDQRLARRVARDLEPTARLRLAAIGEVAPRDLNLNERAVEQKAVAEGRERADDAQRRQGAAQRGDGAKEIGEEPLDREPARVIAQVVEHRVELPGAKENRILEARRPEAGCPRDTRSSRFGHRTGRFGHRTGRFGLATGPAAARRPEAGYPRSLRFGRRTSPPVPFRERLVLCRERKLSVDLLAPRLEPADRVAERLCHRPRHLKNRVQVIGHQLAEKRLDLGGEVAQPLPVRENRRAQFARLDARRHRLGRRLRIVDHEPPQQGPRAVGLDERHLVDRPLAVVPAVAPSRHAVNRLAARLRHGLAFPFAPTPGT